MTSGRIDVESVWALPPHSTQFNDADKVAELAAATAVLAAHVRPDRIADVVRQRSRGLGGRSLLELAQEGDTAGVLAAVQAMFAFESATG